jgi:FkbH-like protein
MTRQPRITAADITSRLGGQLYIGRLAAAAEIRPLLDDPFVQPLADALIEQLVSSDEEELTALEQWLIGLPDTTSARYLRAVLRARAGRHDRAVEDWRALFQHVPAPDPLLAAQRARSQAAVSDWAGAARTLRQALETRPSYTFYARTQALIHQVAAQQADGVREARVAVLGSATTSLLVPILRSLCFRDRIRAEFHEGAFGAFRQEILEPAGRLAAFKPTVVVIATHWRDLDLPPLDSGGDADAAVHAAADEYRALWTRLHEAFDCHVVQHTFDLPANDSGGLLSARLAAGRTRLIRRVNLELADRLPHGVSLLDAEQIAARVGIERWADPRLWYLARQHPSSEALPELAEEQMAHLRAALGLSRKVVVCDLDNTLWKGVIGEDGLTGIKVGAGSAEGEAYADLQRYLRELKARGVVLAVCSKNNPEDARAPFRDKKGMVLTLDDFAVFLANWDDKAANLRRIASEIGVGIDSLVFLDDNPFERAWVREQLPEVAVPELGPSVFGFVRQIDRGRYCPALTWSAEDRIRAEAYRVEHAREQARQNTASMEDFLAGLHMRATCEPVTDTNIERVTQLVNKTNQFNLTTRRRTHAEVRQAAAAGWTGVFSLQDRFGDYGIIGVLFAAPGETPERWDIDTWLMSCRVLRRDVERFMLDRLVDAARAAGVSRLHGRYLRTDKNGLVEDLYPALGFAHVTGDANDAQYELDLATVPGPLSRAIVHAAEIAA